MARIFVCGDTGLTGLLDQVSTGLQDRGHDVIRGPVDSPGVIKDYTAEERSRFINSADIAVFTTRHSCSRVVMQEATRLRGICYPCLSGPRAVLS